MYLYNGHFFFLLLGSWSRGVMEGMPAPLTQRLSPPLDACSPPEDSENSLSAADMANVCVRVKRLLSEPSDPVVGELKRSRIDDLEYAPPSAFQLSIDGQSSVVGKRSRGYSQEDGTRDVEMMNGIELQTSGPEDLSTVLSIFQRIPGLQKNVSGPRYVQLRNGYTALLLKAKDIPGDPTKQAFICRLFLNPKNVQLSLTTAEKTIYSNEVYDSDYYCLALSEDLAQEVFVYDFDTFIREPCLLKDKLFCRFRYRRDGKLVLKSNLDGSS
jgi:hypothetical protein